MATFPADILLQVKTKGVGEQLKSVENFLTRIDNRAKVVEQRLEKLRNPKGFRVAINDKAFDRVVEKSRKLNNLVDRTNNLLAQRTARLNKESSLTNSLVALEKKRRDIVRERLRDEAEFIGKTTNQYKQPIGPRPARRGDRGGQGGIGAAIGFPLLFGGGIGSIAGGVIGSILDDFNGAILGSGLGSTIDRFIDQTVQLSTAFDTATDSTAALEAIIGRLDNETRTRIRNLAQSGQAAKAASAAFDELAKNIGEDNARALVRAGQDFEAVGIAFQKTAAIVGAAITNIFQEALFLNLRDPLSDIPELTPEAQRRVARSTSDLELSRLENAVSRADTPDAQAAAEKELETRKAQLEIEELSKDLAEDSITVLEANNGKRRIAEELATRLLEIEDRRVDANQDIADEKKRAADADRRAAERLAAKAAREFAQAERERERAEQRRLQALSKIDALQIKNLEIAYKVTELEKGRLTAINQELFNLKTKQQYQENIIQRSQEETNVKQAQLELLQKEFELEQKILQAQARQVEQQRVLTALRNTQNSERITTDLGRELEDAQRLPSAFDFDNQALDLRIRQTRRLEDVTRQYTDAIEEQRAIIRNPVDADQRDAAIRQVAALERDLAAYQKLLPEINAAEQAQLRFNQVLEAATPFANAFATGLTSGLQEVIAGTKTAEEAFADFLKNIADLLVQTAAQMIAQYIAIGIARAFAGIPAGSSLSGADPNKFNLNAFGNLFTPGGQSAFAEGGRPQVGAVSLVGERGPELFIPDQPGRIVSNKDSNAAMARFNPGNARSIEELAATGEGGKSMGWAFDPVINVSTGNTLMFEGTNYVTQEDFQAGVSQAAVEGAKAGEARTLRRLRMSPGTRSKLGF